MWLATKDKGPIAIATGQASTREIENFGKSPGTYSITNLLAMSWIPKTLKIGG